ncbi:hypothetical protein F8388_002010 [Cannabis sativa]|uniref:S-protein homolog n=1 Tax=Cannabis sativa TaxID=3483 RepID=A0A7J6FL99_CANSA|nr:hypothetical protein F8388_002010 [Cannabis sativa]KAF4398653.1 hypothetical protein G4B88_013742 [Cannabis sativa]
MSSSTPLNFFSMSHKAQGLLQLVLVAFLLLLSCKTTNVRAWYFQPKTHVVIINGLDSDPSDLTLHCKSKDDDLGTHVVPYNSSYEIVFHPDLLCTTLFFCNFQWPKSQIDHFFNIYDCQRDDKKCKKCKHYIWKISSTGACMEDNKTKDFTICYPWNK